MGIIGPAFTCSYYPGVCGACGRWRCPLSRDQLQAKRARAHTHTTHPGPGLASACHLLPDKHISWPGEHLTSLPSGQPARTSQSQRASVLSTPSTSGETDKYHYAQASHPGKTRQGQSKNAYVRPVLILCSLARAKCNILEEFCVNLLEIRVGRHRVDFLWLFNPP